MFEETITYQTRNNLEILSSKDLIRSFYLAGGTAAALQLGHRVSEDLDFFSKERFSVNGLIDILKNSGELILEKKLEDTLLASFDKTKTSFFYYPYPILESPIPFRGVSLASLIDIACMKVDSISSRGLKRDFIDLFFILKKENKSLFEILNLFEKKYAGFKYNLNHIKKSLVYFDDADREPEPKMLISEFSWPEIKIFFRNEIRGL